MLKHPTLRWLAGLGVAGALVSATPAVAAGPLRVLAADILVVEVVNSIHEIDVALDGDKPDDQSFSLELDLSKVDRLITLQPPSDGWDCDRAGDKLHCEAWKALEVRPRFSYRAMAKAGAAPGDRGELAITATYAGRKANRTINVTVGEDVDLDSEIEDAVDGEPGTDVSLRGIIRNSGQNIVHGAVLEFRPHKLSPYLGNFSNCASRGGQSVVCRFDADLEPGRRYRLSDPLPVHLDAAARTGTLISNFLTWRTKDDWALIENNPDSPVPPGKPGTGKELRLVDDGGRRAAVPQTDVRGNNFTESFIRVTGNSTADLTVEGSTVTGKVGDKVRVRAGVRNLGPAYFEAWPVWVTKPLVTVRVPVGTTAVTVPKLCAPYSSGDWMGQPADNWGRPGAEEYGCLPTKDLAKGAASEYEFSLRIDKLTTRTSGEVRALLDRDPNQRNDKAAITVKLATTGGGGGGGDGGTLPITGSSTGLIAGIGGLLLVAGVGGVLVARRRRTRFVA
ncbi:LPXTG cell wall anchor domain-containing protein [Micromonospora sp. NPDC002296]|uniref:LPXTG cell wall anchor domain-containing protein n=1 Tax=Micromonospora sp. NPDC002296 TaxID=3154271 RepID=UPI003321EAB4